VNESTARVGRFFDGYASAFDSIYDEDRRGPFDRVIDSLFRQVMVRRHEETLRRSASPDIRTVLDVGCGSGRYAIAFLEQGKEVVGVDLAPQMLRLARAAAEQQANPSWQFLECDFLTRDFDRTFDAACMMGYFDYIEHPADHLARLKELVTHEFYASFPVDGGLLARQRKLRYRLRGCPLWLYRHDDVRGLLRSVGLLDVTEFIDLGRDLYVCVRTRDL